MIDDTESVVVGNDNDDYDGYDCSTASYNNSNFFSTDYICRRGHSSRFNSFVSSAFSDWTIGLVYIENNKAQSTEPCGVPEYVAIDLDMLLLMTIVLCVLQVKKLATKFITFESRGFCPGCRSLSSMVLNAKEKSKNTGRQRGE